MVAPPGAPRLGDTLDRFRQAYGPPLSMTATMDGSVHWFRAGAERLAVCFEHDTAVAVHLPFVEAEAEFGREWERLTIFQPQNATGQPRLLAGDMGWVLATPTCRLAQVRAVVALT